MILPRPTALGFKSLGFYAALLGAYFATPYANLLFLLISFLTVLGLLSVAWTLGNVAGLEVEVASPQPVPSTAHATLRGSLRGGLRPRFALWLEVVLERTSVRLLAAGAVRGVAELSVQLPLLPRGIHAIRRVRLASSWPLGLWTVGRDLALPGEVIVYPAPAPSGNLEVLVARFRAGVDPLQPSGLRDWRPGDEPRQVHWKASARRSTLVVKEWDSGPGSGFEVVLDRRLDEEALEEALARVSSLASAAREQKDVLTLHTQGQSAVFGEKQRPWSELWRFLAGAQVMAADGPPPPPAPPHALRLPSRSGERP